MNDALLFNPAKALRGLTPEEYVKTFDFGFEGDARAALSKPVEPLVDALFERRPTRSGDAWRSARGTVDGSFVDEIRTRGVGVAGAGLMGVSIAAAFLNAGFPVLSYDPFESVLTTSRERVAREAISQRLRRGGAEDSPERENALMKERLDSLYRTTAQIDELALKPVVVESTPEKLKLKAKFYRELNRAAKEPVLTLTNTSSLRVDELASSLSDELSKDPLSSARFAGFHFFHPVCKRNLLEIAQGTRTAPETLEKASILARAIGKIPIVVGDGAGFLVNRLLQPYLNESLSLLDEGVSAAQIERACLKFGMEGAPLRVIDEIGVDVSIHAGWSFLKAFPDRTRATSILPELVLSGRLGRKTRLGFYRYESTTSWADDATPIYDDLRGKREQRAEVDDSDVAWRVANAILAEGERLLEDGIVGSKREIDAGLVLALGFPASKGGIFYWKQACGL